MATAGVFAAPYILPGGSLFAPTGMRKVNHVVFCLFAGGIRNYESVQKNDGNLMPSILNGSETISSDIAGSMSSLPAPAVMSPLENFGTLYREFRYDQGPTGHFNGHTTAITGQYTDSSLSLRTRPLFPTVFELYRKHNSPGMSALNSWWVSHSNNLYPILNYSQYPGYGPEYGANQISPTDFFSQEVYDTLKNKLNFPLDNKKQQSDIKNFLNGSFGAPLNLSSGVKNDTEDAEKLEAWIDKMIGEITQGLQNNPWNIPSGMNSDMRNIYYAERIIEEFKPEMMVVNMFGVDVAHNNFSEYCNNLRRADWAVGHLWDTIQKTPGMADDTILIVAPEIGRNGTANSIVDQNGRNALDHTNGDPVSKEIFCLVAGPAGVVKQGNVINQVAGKSVDIVPTIANILGFENDVAGLLPGTVLNDAFI